MDSIERCMVNVFKFKQLNLGAIIHDPILDVLIHSIGALFVNEMTRTCTRGGSIFLTQGSYGQRHK